MDNTAELSALIERAPVDADAANKEAAGVGTNVAKLTIQERCRTAEETRLAIVREAKRQLAQ